MKTNQPYRFYGCACGEKGKLKDATSDVNKHIKRSTASQHDNNPPHPPSYASASASMSMSPHAASSTKPPLLPRLSPPPSPPTTISVTSSVTAPHQTTQLPPQLPALSTQESTIVSVQPSATTATPATIALPQTRKTRHESTHLIPNVPAQQCVLTSHTSTSSHAQASVPTNETVLLSSPSQQQSIMTSTSTVYVPTATAATTTTTSTMESLPRIGWGQAPVKFLFDIDQRPSSLTDYASFVDVFGACTGTCIQYHRHKDHHSVWVLLGNEIKATHDPSRSPSVASSTSSSSKSPSSQTKRRKLQHHSLPASSPGLQNSTIATVKQWHEWYTSDLLPSITHDVNGRPCWDNVNVLYYLTDIRVGGDIHSLLKNRYPDTIGKWGHAGPTCLNQYIKTLYPHVPIPDANYLLYLSPPVPGYILTPAHLDGHGCQMSTHMVLFGGNSYNKVYYWTPQQIGSSGQMVRFRKIMGLAEQGTLQHLPHAKRLEYHTDTEHQCIDASVITQLESIGIYGGVLTLSPGEVIALPAGTFHAFLKCFTINNNSSPLMMMPLLGYAGDNTFIGSGDDMKEMRYNIINMLETQLSLRSAGQPTISYIELGVFSLFNSSPEIYKSDPYTRTVLEALRPMYEGILTLERLTVEHTIPKKHFIDVLNDTFPQELLDRDYACNRCGMGIVNLFAFTTTITTTIKQRQFYCCRCIPSIYTKGSKDFEFLYRFTSTPAK